MDIEKTIADIPDFNKLLVALLGQLGVPVIVCALIALAFTLESYVTPARLAFKGAVSGAAAARRLATFRPLRGPVSVLLTGLVLGAQALSLCMCFLVGNYFSLLSDMERLQAVVDTVRAEPLATLLDPMRLGRFFSLDLLSGSYVSFAAAIIAASYFRTQRPTWASSAGAWMAFPAVLIMGLAVVALALDLALLVLYIILAGITKAFGGDTYPDFSEPFLLALPPLAGLLISALYFAACRSAVRGSTAVVQSWSRL